MITQESGFGFVHNDYCTPLIRWFYHEYFVIFKGSKCLSFLVGLVKDKDFETQSQVLTHGFKEILSYPGNPSS